MQLSDSNVSHSRDWQGARAGAGPGVRGACAANQRAQRRAQHAQLELAAAHGVLSRAAEGAHPKVRVRHIDARCWPGVLPRAAEGVHPKVRIRHVDARCWPGVLLCAVAGVHPKAQIRQRRIGSWPVVLTRSAAGVHLQAPDQTSTPESGQAYLRAVP